MKDGCSILSTVGARRFRVLSGEERDGYDTAQVELLRDSPIQSDRLSSVVELHNEVKESDKYHVILGNISSLILKIYSVGKVFRNYHDPV